MNDIPEFIVDLYERQFETLKLCACYEIHQCSDYNLYITLDDFTVQPVSLIYKYRDEDAQAIELADLQTLLVRRHAEPKLMNVLCRRIEALQVLLGIPPGRRLWTT